MRSVLALGALGAVGCRTHSVVVSPHVIAGHAAQIVADGEATFKTPDGDEVEVDADEQIDVIVKDVDGDTQRPMRLTIRDLVAGCTPDPQGPNCIAMRVPADPGIEHRELRFDKDRLGWMISIGLLGGVAGYGVSQAGADPDLTKGATYIAGGLAIGVGLFVLVIALGGRD